MNDIVAIMRAADFAAHKYVDERRKGEEAEPYLNHLIEVASLVAEATDGIQTPSSPHCCTTRSRIKA
jgi:(p)ppGpp synthase/HD superfamily hydrolase